MTEGQSNFLTEINLTKDKPESKNLRHRQELQAKNFEQVAFFEEEEEKKKLEVKHSKLQEKRKKGVIYDSDSSSDLDSSYDQYESDSSVSDISDCSSEEFNIWDNSEFGIYGLDLDNLKFCNNEEQKFFTLYKLRYCQIREFLTKNLTQKQHQDININILKIVKALSQNKVLKIQCHNYNYFQPLKDNQAYKQFALHFGNYNSTRKCQQIQQKQQHIKSLKDKNSIQKKSFNIKQFDGIRAPMNRASFSSSQKEQSAQSYFLTLRESQNSKQKQYTLVSKTKCDSSLQTQDTFSSQTKRTIKDFEIDSDQKEQKLETQKQVVNKQTYLNAQNFNITSLTHIGDQNENLQKQIEISCNTINQTPQKKEKQFQIQTSNFVSKTANHLSYTSTPLLPQQKNLLNSINQSPNTFSNSICNKIDNSTQSNINSKQPLINNFYNHDSYQTGLNQQARSQMNLTSPFIYQNCTESPKNKTKQTTFPHLSGAIPTRETQNNLKSSININNNYPYQINNTQIIRFYNTKNDSSLSCSRKQSNLNFQSPIPSYKQFDKIPDLKQIKLNNLNNNKLSQIRSSSNHAYSNQSPYSFNESTISSTPLSILNRLAEQTTESTFSKQIEKQFHSVEETIQETSSQLLPQQDSQQQQKIKISSLYKNPTTNLNNKLARQKQVLGSNQSYSTLLQKQNDFEPQQAIIQLVNQEYMNCESDENQNKNIINKNNNEMFKMSTTPKNKNITNNKMNYFDQIQKTIFRKTFFKNQYIDTSSTINKQLVQHFKQITQN